MALEDLFKPRICELGKIKIGRKSAQERKTASGGTWRAPEKLDHFLVTTLQRTTTGDLMPDAAVMDELSQSVGDKDGKIRRLPVFVLSNEIDDILQSAWVSYVGKALAAKSDGKVLTKYIDMKTGDRLSEPEDVPWKEEYKDLKDSKGALRFKLHSTFNCVIASKSGRWGGVYKLRTTSRISGEQLYGSILSVLQLTGGVLRGLPLSLVVRPMQVQPDGKPTTVYVVHLELRGADLHEIQTRALEQKRFEVEHYLGMKKQDERYRLLLKAPGEDEDEEEVTDVVEEFHPETVEEAPSTEPDNVATARRLGAELGMSPGQVEVEIRKALPDHVVDLIDHLQGQLEERGGEAAPLDDDASAMFPEGEPEEEPEQAPKPTGLPPPPVHSQEVNERIERESRATAGRTPNVLEAKARAKAAKPKATKPEAPPAQLIPEKEGRSPYDF